MLIFGKNVESIPRYFVYACSGFNTAIFEGQVPNISNLAFSFTSSYDFEIKNVALPAQYYQDYAALRYSGTTRLFPSDGIVFAEAPTREQYLEKLASVDKAAQTSITFICDNLDENLDEDVIKSAINPNCLIYVPEGCAITGDNFVEIGNGSVTCKSLSLTDGYAFTSPCTIDCQEVEYVHHPSVWANGKSGWETLCLPFSPTSIRASESGYLSPIVLGGNGNFWLRKYVGSSSTSVFFTSTADGVMEANTPYLVAFPGKSMGAGHLEGEAITFSTSNVTIDGYASPEPIKKNAFAFKANYNGIPEAEQGYELNAEGSSFVQSATVGTKPFQAYFTNDELAAGSSVKSLRIDFGTFNDETGIFEVEEGSGMQAGTAGTFYDLSGRRISQGSAQQKGIYISNGRKVIKL